MILLINICKEKLHYHEFVKPIEDILLRNNIKFFTKKYEGLKEEDLKNAEKTIICGTSLKDNKFLKNLKYFKWIKNYEKPILGICAGMQIIGLIYEGKLKKKTEIGFYKEVFNDLLGLKGEEEVYHLHNNYVEFTQDFEEYTQSKINQAVKHTTKNIYGVLFHPEVRQKKLIKNFCTNF